MAKQQQIKVLGDYIDYVTPGKSWVIRLQWTGPNTYRTTVTATSWGAAPEQDTGAVFHEVAILTARMYAKMYGEDDPA